MAIPNFWRINEWCKASNGYAMANAQVFFLAQPANTSAFPPTPQVQLYSDPFGLTPIPQPLVADGYGFVYAYVAAGTYTMVVALSNVIQNVYADQSYGLSGASTAQISLQTNGIPNTNQGLLNLVGAGDVTVNTNVLGQTVIESTGFVIPGTGTGSYVVTAFSGMISAPNNDILTADGSGNAQDSGVLVSSLAPKANTALTGTTTIVLANITSMNGVLNANDFAGADIGAKVNAAIAALPSVPSSVSTPGASGGTVYIPAGVYTQTTTIYLPRYVKLCGAGAFATTLNYTPTTGWAIVVADSLATGGYPPEGALEDMTLAGPGSSSATGAIYIGGTDGQSPVGGTASPSSVNDPDTNYGDDFNINRIRIFTEPFGPAFGVGIQWGCNAWGTTIFESLISGCAIGLYFPNTSVLSNSGERIAAIGCTIADNTIGVKIGGGSPAFGVDFHFIDCSFDINTSWCIQNATAASNCQVHVTHCHFEQDTTYIQNYGTMTVSTSSFVGGGSWATLGWLIDNEGIYFSLIGNSFDVPASPSAATILKPAGVGGICVGNYLPSGVVLTTTSGYQSSLIDSQGHIIAASYLGTVINGGTPYSVSASGAFLGWNYTAGDGEVDFWNNFSQTGATNVAFQWYANVNGTPQLCGSLTQGGNLILPGPLTIQGSTPTGSLTGIALGDTTGIGNSSSANLTALAKGTGTGPASDVAAGWLKINVGGTTAWIPYFE